jgi:2-octaprenyl-6-methoxyphenol hydroxylase
MTAARRHIFVAGGGPAGLAAACLLAAEGIDVVLAAPEGPLDPRTVAVMQPALRLLSYLDLWPGTLQAESSPLRKLRIVDDTGALAAAPDVTFDSKELGEDAFGWNIPLRSLISSLRGKAASLGVTIFSSPVIRVSHLVDDICLELTDGNVIHASMAIAADGAKSVLREAAGIAVQAWSYDQSALATSFSHSASHDGVSTEYYKLAGPMTTVPMPGFRSSLVWMDRPQRIEALAALHERELAAEIQTGTHGELGLISGIGPMKVIPMAGLSAERFGSRRTFLIGEAAHVVPPIGAQGVNMSLRDAALVCDLILAARGDLDADDVVSNYDAKRRHEVVPRQQMIDMMNQSLLLSFAPLEAARSAALLSLSRLAPLRRAVMQLGMADGGALPFAMRV